MSADEITVRDLLESEIGALHTKIDGLGRQVAASMEALDLRITAVQEASSLQAVELRSDIGRVHEQAVATNGNVRKLQLWQARVQGVTLAIGRLPVVIASLAGLASILAVVVALSHH